MLISHPILSSVSYTFLGPVEYLPFFPFWLTLDSAPYLLPIGVAMSSTTEDTKPHAPTEEGVREESTRMHDPDPPSVEHRVPNPGGLLPPDPLNHPAPGANDSAAPPARSRRRNTRAAAAKLPA